MAAEKKSAMTQLKDITECCICLKTFTDPRMLPCIHTFCFQCLQDLAEKSEKKSGDEIKCPVCRKQVSIPSEGVQGVQKNFFMASFIEVKDTFNQLNIAHPCEICKANNDVTDGQTPEAAMRCLVCQENLCEGCCKMHKSFKMSRDHDVVKIGSQMGEKEIIKASQVMNCDTHRGKSLDYYCANCKKIVCVSCFVESHNAHRCKDVNTVEEEFRQNIKSNANIISKLAGELQDKRKKMESKQKFLKKIADRESEILQRSKELKDVIDEHTKFLLSSLDEIKNRHLKKIQVEEEELDRNYAILESFSRYCDELRSKGSASEVCRSKDELLRRADELEVDHEAYIMRPRVSFDVTFEATEIDNWPKTTNQNIIGMLKENVKQLENICVVLDDCRDVYSINLRRPNEAMSRIQDAPAEVHWNTAAAVYDNTLFFTGVGKDENKIWKYSFASGWKRCGSLVQRRWLHCAEFIGKTMFICGGFSKDVVTDSIEAYNALTENTTTFGQLKVGVCHAACVAYKGSIYVIGGRDKYKNSLDCVQLFNPVENNCTLLSKPLPRPCYEYRSVLWENYAILLGDGTCFILDLEEKIWQERQQFKTGVDLFGIVSENGRIFTVGGVDRDDVRYVKASSIVNNEAASWKIHIRLPKTIHVCAIANLTFIK